MHLQKKFVTINIDAFFNVININILLQTLYGNYNYKNIKKKHMPYINK